MTTSLSCAGSRETGSGTKLAADTEWVRDPRGARERWAAAGADGAIVLARNTADVDALVDAAGRW